MHGCGCRHCHCSTRAQQHTSPAHGSASSRMCTRPQLFRCSLGVCDCTGLWRRHLTTATCASPGRAGGAATAARASTACTGWAVPTCSCRTSATSLGRATPGCPLNSRPSCVGECLALWLLGQLLSWTCCQEPPVEACGTFCRLLLLSAAAGKTAASCPDPPGLLEMRQC